MYLVLLNIQWIYLGLQRGFLLFVVLKWSDSLCESLVLLAMDDYLHNPVVEIWTEKNKYQYFISD
jgi:hypothetical protein